jgi:3-methyladenine DNA glycosylase/8-oxoguanine DNA glycosylase
MNHLFDRDDEAAMKELLSFKGIGPKFAFVVMNWCLKRVKFTVDTHVFRPVGCIVGMDTGIRVERACAGSSDQQDSAGSSIQASISHDSAWRDCPFCRGMDGGKDKCEVFDIVDG